jgi:hypothetical protein
LKHPPDTAKGEKRRPPPERPPPLEASLIPQTMGSNDEGANLHDNFTISHLQRLQFVEEKIHHIILELKFNVNVLRALRGFYISMLTNADIPSEIRVSCKNKLVEFERKVIETENDLLVQQCRTETLLCILVDRKRLVRCY